MNAASAPSGIVIGQLKVRWMVDAELREADRARLDRLVRGLCDGPLEDTLHDTADGHPAEVCVRRVVVPSYRTRWDCTDAELVSGWAGAIGRAVSASTVPGRDVVRFASRAHAQADLIVSVLTGDRERVWAWRLLGLWPAGNWPDAEAVARTVAAAVDERPGALVALAVAAARAGQLGRFTDYLGLAALTEYTRHAWRAAGGRAGPAPAADGQAGPGDAFAVRLAALVRRHSQIVTSAPGRLAARTVGPDGSGSADLSASAGSRPPAGTDPLAESLATLALLEVEPAMAAHPAARTAVSVTARGLRPAPVGRPGHRRPPRRPCVTSAGRPACPGRPSVTPASRTAPLREPAGRTALLREPRAARCRTGPRHRRARPPTAAPYRSRRRPSYRPPRPPPAAPRRIRPVSGTPRLGAACSSCFRSSPNSASRRR